MVTGSLWGHLLECTSVLGTISLHPELSKILEMPAPWEIASLPPSPPPPPRTYAEVSVLIVARTALGSPPVHRSQHTPICRLIADPKAQERKPLESIENQSLLLE